MNQAIHIFSKDLRRLWIPVSVMLALQALFTFFEMQPHRGPTNFSFGGLGSEQLVVLLLPVAWWFIIIQLVHEEPIPGDRQFWITRPYGWKSLLAAKVLPILALINLPILISDLLILTAQGFSVAGNWKGLLWRQIPLTLVALLPPLALGSLTRNIGQVIVAILLVVLRVIANSIPFHDELPTGFSPVAWIETTVDAIVLLAVLAAVVLIQYRGRRTWIARGLFAAFVIFPGLSLPLRWQLDWQARVKPPPIDVSGIRIAFDPARGRRTPLAHTPGVTLANVALPVTVSGLPNGVELVSNMANINVGGKSFSEGARLERDKTGYWETIMIPANVFAPIRNTSATVRIGPVVTAVRETEFRVPLETGPVLVPDVGICASSHGPQFLDVYCRWAWRAPLRTRIRADPGWNANDQVTGDLSDSPFPAGLTLSPAATQQVFFLTGDELSAVMNHPGTQLVFETDHPIANFQTQIELPAVRLDDYTVMASEQ